MSIEVRNATRAFGSFQALRGINLTVPTGQFLALLGPSGSGKTTLLRIIAGLDRADEGAVFINGQDATEQGARGRNVGFVFQHYALFRHMSVFENVAFGLRVRPRDRRPSEAQIRARVDELLTLVQLDFLAHRLPSELSGGQRQRVALARALAVQPAVLLLDEPFGALDAKVRQELRSWLRRLHDEIGLTSVFVTHDQEEALELADRVVIFNHGVIEQDGTPEDVVDHPATPFVANFVGRVNVFHGRLESGKAWFGPVVVDHPTPAEGATHAEGYARPHELDVTREEVGGGLWAILRHASPAGAIVKVDLVDADGRFLHVEIGREQFDALAVMQGERVYVRPRRLRVFPRDAAHRLTAQTPQAQSSSTDARILPEPGALRGEPRPGQD